MIPLIDIIRADNKRYAELLEVFQRLADVTADGPFQILESGTGDANEGRVSETESVAPSTGDELSEAGQTGGPGGS